MAEIPLVNGGVAIVDDDQYERFAKYQWRRNKEGYAFRGGVGPDGKWTYVMMHRCLLWAPPGMETDHINGNRLDNRRENLRLATKAQNRQNRPAPNTGKKTSKYKGVHWSQRHKKWVAKIKANCETRHLGYFDDEVEAATAYNEAARELHGEFARLNEIQVS